MFNLCSKVFYALMLAFTGRSIDDTSDILSSDLYFRRFARQRRTTMTQTTQIITAARTDETVIRTTRVASENSKHLYFTKTFYHMTSRLGVK